MADPRPIERHGSALGAFSDAVELRGPGRLIQLAGHVAVGDDGAVVTGGIVPETRMVIANLERSLARAGAGLSDLTRMLVFLVCLDDFPAFVEVRSELLGAIRPVSTVVQVAGLLLGAHIEVEATAFVPERARSTPPNG